VLQRIRDFVPRMREANQQLEAEPDKSRFNMEIGDDNGDDGPVIEMELGIGVFEPERDSEQESSYCSDDGDNPMVVPVDTDKEDEDESNNK